MCFDSKGHVASPPRHDGDNAAEVARVRGVGGVVTPEGRLSLGGPRGRTLGPFRGVGNYPFKVREKNPHSQRIFGTLPYKSLSAVPPKL